MLHDLLALLRATGEPHTLLEDRVGATVYPRSLAPADDAVFFLARRGQVKLLGVLAARQAPDLELAWESTQVGSEHLQMGTGPLSAENAQALRAYLPQLVPVPLGLQPSIGLGDRLGLATPGHIRALRRAPGLAPILAQQSIREMERTSRSPQQVIDAASWGALQEGWLAGYGADADHLKTEGDIDLCAPAGFVLYTLDPREHVDAAADSADLSVLRAQYNALPWERLASTPAATLAAYAGHTWTLDDGSEVHLDEEGLLRAADKYGRAVAHLAALARYLSQRLAGRAYEIEISVDETDTPTRPAEHWYVARELQRLGVRWVSLAPRFVGRFEKGVDYIGDLATFEEDLRRHVAIARTLGPYKLSLHSGSDKFSLYPAVARIAGRQVHVKTAGTSYLEALRALAHVDAPLLRAILAFAVEHYEEDRRSYHVSADMAHVPDPREVADTELPALLDQHDARQALHVTFGTVLTARDSTGAYRFRDRLYQVLADHEETHDEIVAAHLARHMRPFADRFLSQPARSM